MSVASGHLSAAVDTINTTARATRRRLSSPWASLAAIAIAAVWTLPTFGLLVTSFRPQAEIQTSGWWTTLAEPSVTLENYREVLGAQNSGSTLFEAFINSMVITVPAVVFPLGLALLAAYAFAWIRFRGRDFLFVVVFALQIVPVQVTLIPLLELYVQLDLAGTFWPVWISHSIFSLPLAVFLLHNFMRGLPRELVEAARIDGAGHAQILGKVLLPLLVPAIASYGIFQFLWVWNDLLVGLTFANTADTNPMTVALANLAGNRGNSWYLLSAAAFVSMIVPLIVFLGMQRFFVRGLLAGSVKG
jgi:alpha-glucoside transport system permease protein